MLRPFLRLRWVNARIQRRPVRRAALALSLASVMGAGLALATAMQRNATTSARLEMATEQLDSLTAGVPDNDDRRAAIAWGYAERLRLGLDSPFRLIELAANDPRLTESERRTVSWALLAHVVQGETYEVDPAVFDPVGPSEHGRKVSGEQHLSLIRGAITRADNPRAAELAVRFAYTLASAERIVDGSAPLLAAEAAALLADGEIARREAHEVVRSTAGTNVIELVRRRRSRRGFYVERPVLLAPDHEIERDAIGMVRPILDSLRAMRPSSASPGIATEEANEEHDQTLADHLSNVGALAPPAAALAVTVQRYLPVLRSLPRVNVAALQRATNPELLVAAMHVEGASRTQRRAMGRLLLSAAVSMRSSAQEPVWFPGDSTASAATVASTIGIESISFDWDVPVPWRPYFLRSLETGVRDLRRVLPGLRLEALRVRFRMTSPADSALAMHDPRSRTLHLPATTSGGTLLHELAHELDRQSAVQRGVGGYRSDAEARAEAPNGRSTSTSERVAASLRALTEDLMDMPRFSQPTGERPAEIFATRVDWFVAQALARDGISSGFLTAVQDELLTGHVVHPERLRTSGRARSLLDALEGMTTLAPRARQIQEPTVHTLLRWSLAGPVDRRMAAGIVRGGQHAWALSPLIGERTCNGDARGRTALVRMAAESRARGWLLQRARWMAVEDRPAWARGMLRQVPWDAAVAEQRAAELRDYVLVQLASDADLPAGLGAYAAPLAAAARCN